MHRCIHTMEIYIHLHLLQLLHTASCSVVTDAAFAPISFNHIDLFISFNNFFCICPILCLSFLPGISPGCFLLFAPMALITVTAIIFFLFWCQFSYFFVIYKSSYFILFHSVPSSLLSLFVSACLLCSIRWGVLIHLLTCSQDLDARLYDRQGFLVQFLKILHCSFKHVFSFLCHIFHLLSFVSLFRWIDLRPIYSHIDKRLIGEAPRGFGAKDFFWIAVRNRLHLDRTECQSICCLICFYFFLCCQNSILLVYLHLSSYNELTGHCHVQVNKEGEHYFGNT